MTGQVQFCGSLRMFAGLSVECVRRIMYLPGHRAKCVVRKRDQEEKGGMVMRRKK